MAALGCCLDYVSRHMPTAVVVDKCFLQGAPKSRVLALAQTHRLLVSDALFYELLTGSEPGRSRCFAKLPQTENPVDLVSHIGVLMRKEIETQVQAGRPSTHREDLRFKFNPALLTGKYQLPEVAQHEIERQSQVLRADVVTFIERAEGMPSFFADLLQGSEESRQAARASAEAAVAEPGALLSFYSQLEPPLGEKALPPPGVVNESWALYRWLQVQFLFGIDVCVRYQGKVPKEFSSTVFEKLEHDVLDAQLLMLACLEGAFATRERKLQRWWRLLRPDGVLFE